MVSLPIVLLIFISSNYPQSNVNDGIITPPTAPPKKGFSDSGKSPEDYTAPVNDLTATEFKFPDDSSRGLLLPNKKIIREKLVPDDLVKNDCGEGYALDENGVCQKTIAVRSGKKLDADRRRKRQVSNYEWLFQKKPTNAEIEVNGQNSRKAAIECKNLYPGLVGDKNGGCRKATGTSERAFDKALPP